MVRPRGQRFVQALEVEQAFGEVPFEGHEGFGGGGKGRIGERRLRDLLRALVVKHALTLEEIVDGHLNRNARGYHPLPEVRQDRGEGHHLMCGDGVHAVVRVIER